MLAPDDHTLSDYLLGNLSPDRAGPVTEWLSSDPSAADACRRVAADDPLTAALADASSGDAVPPPSVERFVRSVLEELGGARTPFPAVAPARCNDRGQHSPRATTTFPAKLGGYRLVREIGRGGMGVVHEAEDEALRRRVAVKVMSLELVQRPHARERFGREARAAAAIEHENVVPIHHVGEESGLPFIVMPLLRGETLDDRLNRDCSLPPAEVIRLGREVAAGLAAAHVRGLVHRDIKPVNIWLAGDTGKAVILDFGLARAADGTDGVTAPNALPGTPAYMAPEQVEGKPADARSDLFSLGATLYRCATGRPAFTAATVAAILRAVTAHHPSPPHEVNPEVPGPLSDLIMRLLAKNPSERPPSAQHVVHDLVAPREEPTLPQPSGREPVPQPTREQGGFRSRWAVLIGAAAVILLAVVGGWFAMRPPWQGMLKDTAPAQVHYRGNVTVLVERADKNGAIRLLRLNEAGVLPLRQNDKFRIEGQVHPPAYVYVVWVDPGHDVTPVYPWDAKAGWGRRPAKEEPVGVVNLPPNAGKRYTAPNAKPGVATMVLFARPTPLDVSDEEVRKWFEGLPDLPLPPGGDQATVWFDNYTEVREPDRLRTFGEVGSDDAFARWQAQLQRVLGDKAAFQTAVSFARTGGK
jgi:hypothetical protein